MPTAQTATPARPNPENSLTSESPDWWQVLAELDRRRARALTALDPDLLADYAQSGSPAWSTDAALVSDLRERGLRPQGLTSRVLAVERSERQGGRAEVQVVDQRSAYTLVDAQGSVVELVPQAGLTRWWVTLVLDAGDDLGWRVADVTAVRHGAGSGEGTGPDPGEGPGDVPGDAAGDAARDTPGSAPLDAPGTNSALAGDPDDAGP